MSLFGTIGRSIVDARMKQARGQLYATLLDMDDEMLRKAGFDRKELRKGATHRFLI
jgi:hypothetical protein